MSSAGELLEMSDEERVDREERAAVFEYEAGFSREVAEMLAGLRPNPQGITPELAARAKESLKSPATGGRPRAGFYRQMRRGWRR